MIVPMYGFFIILFFFAKLSRIKINQKIIKIL